MGENIQMKSYKDLIIEMAEYKAFHGTGCVFSIWCEYPNSQDDYGQGFYFTNDPEEAEEYAKWSADWVDGAENIHPVTLIIDNPIILDEWDQPTQPPLNKLQIKQLFESSKYGYRDGFMVDIYDKNLFDQYLDLQRLFDTNLEFSIQFKKVAGYDGLIHKTRRGYINYVVWNPKQIKQLGEVTK